MVPQIKCIMVLRGLEENCKALCDELKFEKIVCVKMEGYYEILSLGYFPCDMELDFSFKNLALQYSINVSYVFLEYSNQFLEYSVDYNLDAFLEYNNIHVEGTFTGFGEIDNIDNGLDKIHNYLLEEIHAQNEFSGESDWFTAFEALAEYSEKLMSEGAYEELLVDLEDDEDELIVRVRFAAESGDQYAKQLLDNYDNASL